MRNLLDSRFDMEVALVDLQALSCTNVNLHTVIALVNGTYTSIESACMQCSGRMSLMTDNPDVRSFWYGTNKLILSGIFFSDRSFAMALQELRSRSQQGKSGMILHRRNLQ